MEIIRCRARVSADCYDGREISAVYENEIEMRKDGTFNGRDYSVVCEPCYMTVMPMTASGRGLTHEIPGGIHNKRTQLLGVDLIIVGRAANWTEEQFGGVAFITAKHKGDRPHKVTTDRVEVTRFDLDRGDIVAHYGGEQWKITPEGMIMEGQR